MEFKDKLAMSCRDLRWTQSDLWRALQEAGKPVSRNTVSRWFSGAVRPYDPVVVALAILLRKPLEWLIDDRFAAIKTMSEEAAKEQKEIDRGKMPFETTELADDEKTIVYIYRAMKRFGELDFGTAMGGLLMAKKDLEGARKALEDDTRDITVRQIKAIDEYLESRRNDANSGLPYTIDKTPEPKG